MVHTQGMVATPVIGIAAFSPSRSLGDAGHRDISGGSTCLMPDSPGQRMPARKVARQPTTTSQDRRCRSIRGGSTLQTADGELIKLFSQFPRSKSLTIPPTFEIVENVNAYK